ncbi:MAG: YkgJ family cysteine cluster protein [Thermoguttaceae bacterium]|nr:YkgJ family cysteine cluster protein [Thermoguttaceae bacterium]MDW8079788.1 YkgJ family cysteine cluster protein [Thermoguttaceae bacterium]
MARDIGKRNRKRKALGLQARDVLWGSLLTSDGKAKHISDHVITIDRRVPGIKFQKDVVGAVGRAWPLTINGRKPRRHEVPPGANLCQYCSAKCCQYLAIQIDEPTTARQFDYLVWFLLHRDVLVFREKGRWFVLFQTPCTKLLADGRCGIYQKRPRICRTYSTKRCEYEDDWVYERVFETPEQVYEFAEVVLAPPGRVRRTLNPAAKNRQPLGSKTSE